MELGERRAAILERQKQDFGQMLFRSKGFFWLATRNDDCGEFSQAGLICQISKSMRWFAATPREQWPSDDPKFTQDILSDFDADPAVGDRRQEIVFIGQNLDQARITQLLDSCLVTDEERCDEALGKAMEDPFSEWPEDLEDDDDEEGQGEEEINGEGKEPGGSSHNHHDHHGHHHHHRHEGKDRHSSANVDTDAAAESTSDMPLGRRTTSSGDSVNNEDDSADWEDLPAVGEGRRPQLRPGRGANARNRNPKARAPPAGSRQTPNSTTANSGQSHKKTRVAWSGLGRKSNQNSSGSSSGDRGGTSEASFTKHGRDRRVGRGRSAASLTMHPVGELGEVKLEGMESKRINPARGWRQEKQQDLQQHAGLVRGEGNGSTRLTDRQRRKRAASSAGSVAAANT